MVNEELIRLIMRQIEDTPEHWNQGDWVRSSEVGDEDICKTTFCFAGWAAFLTDMVDGWGLTTAAGERYKEHAGYDTGSRKFFPYDEYAQEVLGLTPDQSAPLFDVYADGGDFYGASTGERIRKMKNLIYQLTGVDIF